MDGQEQSPGGSPQLDVVGVWNYVRTIFLNQVKLVVLKI